VLQHAKPSQWLIIVVLLACTGWTALADDGSDNTAPMEVTAPAVGTQPDPTGDDAGQQDASDNPDPVADAAVDGGSAGPDSGDDPQDDGADTSARETAEAMVIDMRSNLDRAKAPAPQAESRLVEEYQNAIREAELSGGAYSGAIAEHLLGLGTTLQQLNRHEEAVEVLKRGVHLSRINSGLYSSEQLALLRSEIRSHMAMGNFDVVDERQRYLYRVERRALSRSSESTEALIRQAEWQRQAFLLEVGEPETQAGRLMIMWDLYRMALNESIDIYGEQAIELKAPLEGMIATQYLFAGYRGYLYDPSSSASDLQAAAMTNQSFRRGESVLKAILEVNVLNKLGPEQQIQDTVALGDWAWWYGKFNDAEIYYSQAMTLIDELPEETAPALKDALFGAPVALPRLEEIRPLPDHDTLEDGALVIGFDLTDTGRVTNVERLREPEVEEEKAIRRLVRALKNTRFRPPFSDGMPVRVEGLVWSFEPEAWRVMVRDEPEFEISTGEG